MYNLKILQLFFLFLQGPPVVELLDPLLILCVKQKVPCAKKIDTVQHNEYDQNASKLIAIGEIQKS